ncbi:MAG: excinuclease ABC subunit UvrB [Planctomycetes bacterium]|nr:excinuclease ABC subunit UvrB [Planctomycetota bacterium]
MHDFQLVSSMNAAGDQPAAIEKLSERVRRGERFSTLLGVTGSGKTFTLAHLIERVRKPALVISHNKTLAAQLYSEFRELFPHNAVHYFVSYYDYYQPEAYIPQRDIYIEKDADINDDIDRLRLAATSSLLWRRDVIIVASVSCIYGLGSPEDYKGMVVPVACGRKIDRPAFVRSLIDVQYERSDASFTRGKFRIRGETIDVYPSYEETALRIQFDGDVIERVAAIHPVSGEELGEVAEITVYPAKHFVMPEEKIEGALHGIEAELEERLKWFRSQGKLLEAQRLEARARYDLELLREVGYCKGIENYSRHLSGRKPGERPATLIDYFPKDFLCLVDESHVTLPQIHGMYNGDRARKQTLVDYGFRLPSALDNRPMRYDEWVSAVPQIVFVSATPGDYEVKMCGGNAVEQIIRPTGLVDPNIRVEPARGQVPHLLEEIKKRVAAKERVLVTTLTKRLAEDLSTFLEEEEVRCRYLHSEVETIERVEILRQLREGAFDVLVGVNLLREGLDLPEVSLVAILDADKEGFLRSTTSIIQTVGRTARNVNGEVILYADTVTPSMRAAIEETERRRALQLAYNEEHGITPKTIVKEIRKGIEEIIRAKHVAAEVVHLSDSEFTRTELVAELERQMHEAAEKLEFEAAAALRDEIRRLSGQPGAAPPSRRRGSHSRRGAPERPRITYRVTNDSQNLS